ncbi:DUF4097 family beta strand repeat-containing protein [Saccharothrix yanglingensis]|uniref:DUF4097 domain-containing protein n=1 Tax=Saccharothrix yanglingensis TaxID=659496 RepID=A0ABU0WYI3_9PSEU|nr:DUF4097 family beta strand repeat-containing protein [Saccharothrix yanglingensis]MDQ2584568.1 hypothetical protein [Saccharothrix yanglingensis]
MPIFDTPDPIEVDLDLVYGGTLLTAGERDRTTVEVRPTDPASEKDVKAAGTTTVEFHDGRLTVRSRRTTNFLAKPGSVDLVVELPAGSAVTARGQLVDFRGEGALGECRIKTSAGHIRLQDTGAARLETSTGDIAVARASGRVDVRTGSGEVRIGTLDGSGEIKNSNGATRLGEVTGEVRVNAANGGIVIDRAGGDVHARSAHGHIRVHDVARGSVTLETSVGELEVGVREGTAAWLDVRSRTGRVRNELSTSDAPGETDERVEVRGRTTLGDILVRRA